MTAIFPICVVQQGTQCILKRWGKIVRVLNAGVHQVTPLLDEYVYVNWQFSDGVGSRVRGYEIPTNRQVFDPRDLQCTTADQLLANIDLQVEFRVTDVIKAVTQTENLFASIEAVILSAAYDATRRVKFVDLVPRTLEDAVTAAVARSAGEYGFQLVRVFVESIVGPRSITAVTEAVETQRRQKVAELDKLKQEGEIKLSQLRLQLQVTEAEGVEQQVRTTNRGKRLHSQTSAETAADRLRVDQEIDAQQKRQATELEWYSKRLTLLAKSSLSDSVKIALLNSDALQALAKDPSTKLVLGTQDALRASHLHLGASPLPDAH